MERDSQEVEKEIGDHTRFGFIFDNGDINYCDASVSKHKPTDIVVFGGFAVRDDHGFDAQFADLGGSASLLSGCQVLWHPLVDVGWLGPAV